MNKTGCLLIALLCFLQIMPVNAYFVSDLGTGGGARPLGMGGSFVAIADDPNALYWNPAGLSLSQGNKLSSMHVKLFGSNVAQSNYFYTTRVRKNQGVGIGYDQINYGQFGTVARTYLFGYGWDFNKKWQFGVTGKYMEFSSDITDWGAVGRSLDFGVIYAARANLKIGLTGKNIFNAVTWNTGISERLTQTFSLGTAYFNPLATYSLGFDYVKDVSIGSEPVLKYKFGIEKDFGENLTLRFGWLNSSLSEDGLGSFSGGFGYHYQNWQVDYSFVSGQGDLSGTHFISATLEFSPQYNELLRKSISR